MASEKHEAIRMSIARVGGTCRDFQLDMNEMCAGNRETGSFAWALLPLPAAAVRTLVVCYVSCSTILIGINNKNLESATRG